MPIGFVDFCLHITSSGATSTERIMGLAPQPVTMKTIAAQEPSKCLRVFIRETDLSAPGITCVIIWSDIFDYTDWLFQLIIHQNFYVLNEETITLVANFLCDHSCTGGNNHARNDALLSWRVSN